MLLRRLELENVRCFSSHAVVDFTHRREGGEPHKWIVVFGENGTGKSTLLRAIALALTGQPALNYLVPSAGSMVRDGEQYAQITVELKSGEADFCGGLPRDRPFRLTWVIVGNRAFPTRPAIDVGAPEGGLLPAHSISLKKGAAETEQADSKLFLTQIATDAPRRGWLLLGYGPHRRLTGASSDLPDSWRVRRVMTLFHEKAALASAEQWLKDLHHGAALNRSPDVRVLELVKRLLDAELLHEGVKLSEISPEGVFFDTPYKARVPMAELSDGYRTTLAFLLDVLQHVSHAFDLGQVIRVANGHAVVDAEAVVLIDEIDSHLHPEWQRTLPRWLRTRFPNVQFIVATHSPLIPSCVEEGDGLVVRLRRIQDGPRSVVQPELDLGRMGLTADQNLTSPNFGLSTTRDVLTEELEGEVRRLRRGVKDQTATVEDRARLVGLQRRLLEVAPASPTYEGASDWAEQVRALLAVDAAGDEPA